MVKEEYFKLLDKAIIANKKMRTLEGSAYLDGFNIPLEKIRWNYSIAHYEFAKSVLLGNEDMS